MSHEYDEEADVLYISIGEPRASVAWEPQEDLVIHRDILTGELVAMTVVNWKSRFSGHPELIVAALREALPKEALDLIAA